MRNEQTLYRWVSATMIFNVAFGLILSIYLITHIGEPYLIFHAIWGICVQAIISALFGLKVISYFNNNKGDENGTEEYSDAELEQQEAKQAAVQD